MSREIRLTVTNLFTGNEALIISMPYRAHKAIYGFYSSLWKRLKKSMSIIENVPENKIKITHNRTVTANKIINRMVFEFESGVILDLPEEMNDNDWDITIAQLKVLMMSNR